MMHEARWNTEVKIMNQYFPDFEAVTDENGSVGFRGYVLGPRTGRLYTMTVKIPASRYPEKEPGMYINPRIGSHWRIDQVNQDPRGRRLDICRDKPWDPRINTFA